MDLTATRSDTDPNSVLRTILVAPFRLRTVLDTLYNALAFPLGLLWFVTFVPLIVLSFGLVPLALSGVVLIFVVFVLAQGATIGERALANLLLPITVDEPRRRPRTANSPWAHLWARLADPVTYKELLYLLLRFPLGIASFVAISAIGATIVAGVFGAPLASGQDDAVVIWIRGPDVSAGPVVANLLTALVALYLAPWVMRFLGLLHGLMAQFLLGRSREEDLEDEVDRLADSRERSVDATTTERARIERDLHDGAQARLVTLAMDLGRARSRLEAEGHEGPAAGMVADAHDQAKQALAEIRDLARGIHPAVLTDRGLDAAISALAAGSPLPVAVDVHLPHRLEPRLEAVAYFVLAELLVNVARHSQASAANVSVVGGDEHVTLEVRDDGIGGADPQQGTGLAGLAERLQSVDGQLHVDSPTGGPTLIRAEIPVH